MEDKLMNNIDYISEVVESKPVKLVFSNKKDKGYKYKKIRINLKGNSQKEYYQVECFTDKQVFHENISFDELSNKIEEYMVVYRQMNAFSAEHNFEVKLSKKGKIFFNKGKNREEIFADKSHNKKKKYILEEGMYIPPLIDLGIFSEDGKIINSKYDKYKQINRFVEIIDDEIKRVEDKYKNRKIHILDFGCGKSYLTFILYYYFSEVKNIDVKITGLDLKEDVIEKCNKIAKKYGYKNLKFEIGDINGYTPDENIDMVITLHACDTATDYALYNAISWDVDMIFSVPCCQHEINSTIKTESMSILTKYGIIKERMSALITDSVRANLLEVCGYRTQLLEFIDISHSPKNILIRAKKSNLSNEKKRNSLSEINRLMEEMSFESTLYKLLDESDRLNF